MRRLIKTSEAPPGFFRYVHSETKHITEAVDYQTWVSAAIEHRRANGLPVPDDFEWIMQDQLCGTLPPELCNYEVGDPQWVNTNLSPSDVVTATRALLDSVFGNYVSQDEAERRADICSSCQFNVPIRGCGVCHQLSGLIARGRSTNFDSKLNSCAICKCYNRPQVHIRLDTLSAHATSERQAKYPDFCWQKIGGNNYLENDGMANP